MILEATAMPNAPQPQPMFFYLLLFLPFYFRHRFSSRHSCLRSRQPLFGVHGRRPDLELDVVRTKTDQGSQNDQTSTATISGVKIEH